MNQFEVYTVSSLEKVFPQERPVMYEQENSCLKNEVFSFQIAYRNSERELMLQNCRWQVEGDLKEYIMVRPVFPAPCTTPKNSMHDDYVLIDTPTLVPEILREDETFYVRFKDFGSLWVTVKGVLPAGKHKIYITLTNANKEVLGKVTYDLEVLNAQLPVCDLKYAHWFHYDSLAEYYKLPVFGKEFNEVMQDFISNAVSHGVNMLLVPLFTPPLNTAYMRERTTVQLIDVSLNKGRYTFGFDRLKWFMELAASKGVCYYEMSHLYTQWGASHAPKVMATVDGEYKRLFWWENTALSQEYTEFMKLFLSELVNFLKKEGYNSEQCYFHISDEPNEKSLEHYNKIRQLIKPILGEFKIFDALSNYDFYASGAVDVPVVSTDCVQPFADNMVSDYWVYYCCGQGNKWLSNRFMSMPLQRVRILGMQMYAVGCQGFLHWGYNYYNSSLSERYIDPYVTTDADGSFQSGDGFIVYPAQNGKPLDSIRHEVMFDAFQDYRALKLLEKQNNRQYVLDFLTANGLQPNFTDYPKSAIWHTSIRKKINKLIK